jgi:hypothetical protein
MNRGRVAMTRPLLRLLEPHFGIADPLPRLGPDFLDDGR